MLHFAVLSSHVTYRQGQGQGQGRGSGSSAEETNLTDVCMSPTALRQGTFDLWLPYWILQVHNGAT